MNGAGTFNALIDTKYEIYISFIQVLFILKVKKKVSADMIKKIYLKIEKYGIEMKRLGSILEEMQKEKIVIEKQREYVDECIAQFMR